MKGGPLDGRVYALPEESRYLKVVTRASELDTPTEVGTRTEFYVRVGEGCIMEFQPHPH